MNVDLIQEESESADALWKEIHHLKETDPDSAWLSAVIQLIQFFGTKDPIPIHYLIAREILEQNQISEDKCADMLARELVIACQKFKHYIEEQDIALHPIDSLFAQFLELHFFKTGKEASQALQEDSKKRLQRFAASEFDPSLRPSIWNNWIQSQKNSFKSPYLYILADIVWRDCCEAVWSKQMRNVPALTQGVHPRVAKILSHRTEIKDIENTMHLMHETQIIAKLPTVDPSLIQMVTKGIGKLNSLYHHKLIRFECKAGFENWTAGKADSRVLRFERGCSEIAEKLQLQSNQAIETIKALLHAQAHLQFNFEDGSCGNLIILNKFRSSSSGREEGIMITLGPQLLPHYTFQTSKKSRLLIPVPQLPPLIGSSNSHASQAALQMLLMQLFADKSIELAELGSIQITEEEWNKLSKEAGLSASLFKQIIDRWLNDGDDGAKMLVLSGVDRYSLGPAYAKEQKFLMDQGALRKKRQKGGEKSAKGKQ